MKKKGSIMEYSNERSEDLFRVYKEYIANCKYITMPEVYKTITNMPSRRFWVSDTRAALVVSSIIREGKQVLNSMWLLKREMYEEIYNRVIELKKTYPNKSITELCSSVVEQPAPKFYLTPGSAKILLCKIRRQKANEHR
jgi:hypothetical protein